VRSNASITVTVDLNCHCIFKVQIVCSELGIVYFQSSLFHITIDQI